MEYKVGDKVWLIDVLCYGIITTVKKGISYLYKIEYNNQYGIFKDFELHDTFDTMITRLGFEKRQNLKSSITNLGVITYVKEVDTVDIQVTFRETYKRKNMKSLKDTEWYYYVIEHDKKTNKITHGIVFNDLHEALTQLMTELKAKEME